MKQDEFAINKIMIASPCSIGWENMEGDERVRFCNACQRVRQFLINNERHLP
jgi:hypothetical protein